MSAIEAFLEQTRIDPLIYVLINEFSARTGMTKHAIQKKISSGKWSEGREYIKDPDNRIHINIINYQKWIESQWQAKREQEEQFSRIAETSSAMVLTGSTRKARITPIDGDSKQITKRMKQIG